MSNMLDSRYVAGLFDGEGCVMIKRNGKHRPQITMVVGSTYHPIVLELQKQYGGSIYLNQRHRNNKQVYAWDITGKAAIAFLNNIAEFVIIKKKQVNLVFNYWLELDEQKREQMIIALNKMNRRGVTVK